MDLEKVQAMTSPNQYKNCVCIWKDEVWLSSLWFLLNKNHIQIFIAYLPCVRCCEYNGKKETVLALKEIQFSEAIQQKL